MNPKQIQCIEESHDYFVTNMSDVKKVCDVLHSNHVLTRNMVEDIMVKDTATNQVRALSTQITKRPENAYNAYYHALIKSGNPQLAQRLEPYLSPELTPAQGGDGQMTDTPDEATSGESNADVSSSSQKNQHIMISYQRKNQRTMEDVRDALKERGYEVWMDVDDMTGNTFDAMSKAVENSFVVLVAGSEEYIKSVSCKQEAEYASRKKKPMILLSMEPNFKADGWFGFITKSLISILFTRSIAFDDSFNKLLKQLEAIRPSKDNK